MKLMRLGFFPLLGSIPEEALAYEQVRMAQYMIGQLLKRQFFVVVFFFLMVSFVIFFLASVVLIQKGQEGIAKFFLMVCGVFQELVKLHEVRNRQMQALQEQEGREEHGKQSRHRFKDTISADTIQAITAFCIRSCPKIKNSLKSGI
jgi:lipopolysaccharide/colanic/teichoic acid biosynthesis glycosyltransferase